jgi:hypothetical protein
MADTELTGVLKLTLDKTAVDKDLKNVQASTGSGSTAGKKPGEAQGKDFAKTFAAEVKKSLGNSMQSVLGVFGKPGAMMGNTIRSLMSSPAAGAAATSGAAPIAGGTAATAAKAGAAGGPIGMAVVAAGVIVLGFGIAVKKATEFLIDFGRGLSQFSAGMGMAFKVFDMQIMNIKRQLGDALSPAMNELLQSITPLVREALPSVITAFKMLVNVLTPILKFANIAMKTSGIGMSSAIADKIGLTDNPTAFSAVGAFNSIYDKLKGAPDPAKDPNRIDFTKVNQLDNFQKVIEARDKKIAQDAANLRAQWAQPGNP